MREISRRYRSVVHPEVHFSPAKLNLYLAVTGRRADGFHDLVSLAVPLVWGDELRVTPTDGAFTLTCNDPAVPVDDTNLVLRAAHSFRTATGWTGGARFVLEKRIPMGAGLGGGSSNATIALRALNHLAGAPLAPKASKARSIRRRAMLSTRGNWKSWASVFLHWSRVNQRASISSSGSMVISSVSPSA